MCVFALCWFFIVGGGNGGSGGGCFLRSRTVGESIITHIHVLLFCSTCGHIYCYISLLSLSLSLFYSIIRSITRIYTHPASFLPIIILFVGYVCVIYITDLFIFALAYSSITSALRRRERVSAPVSS